VRVGRGGDKRQSRNLDAPGNAQPRCRDADWRRVTKTGSEDDPQGTRGNKHQVDGRPTTGAGGTGINADGMHRRCAQTVCGTGKRAASGTEAASKALNGKERGGERSSSGWRCALRRVIDAGAAHADCHREAGGCRGLLGPSGRWMGSPERIGTRLNGNAPGDFQELNAGKADAETSWIS
jgi:hypothetical protein